MSTLSATTPYIDPWKLYLKSCPLRPKLCETLFEIFQYRFAQGYTCTQLIEVIIDKVYHNNLYIIMDEGNLWRVAECPFDVYINVNLGTCWSLVEYVMFDKTHSTTYWIAGCNAFS